jgi:hypothetical protein
VLQAAAEDFPAEAFLMRPALLEHAASLLHTADDDHRIVAAALAFLSAFMRSLRRALASSRDPSLALPASPAPTADHEDTAAVAERVQSRALNYPPPPPPAGGARVAVAPALHLVVRHALSLLGVPANHVAVLPLLGSALPLLHAPPGAPVSGWTLRARWVTGRTRWVTRRARWVTGRTRWVTLRARWVTGRTRWVTRRARWVTGRTRWVTRRARWVTGRARWVTRRARWVTLRARWVTLRARWVTRRARWVT